MRSNSIRYELLNLSGGMSTLISEPFFSLSSDGYTVTGNRQDAVIGNFRVSQSAVAAPIGTHGFFDRSQYSRRAFGANFWPSANSIGGALVAAIHWSKGT